MTTFWTVYDHPKDFPNEFVGRRWHSDDAGRQSVDAEPFAVGPTIESIREKIPTHAYRLPHQPGQEDPVIAETWMEQH